MKPRPLSKQIIPILAVLVASLMLLAAPFLAYQWYTTPFIGAFIEPNLVLSQISGADWPARQAGAQLGDRLTAVNGQPIKSEGELQDFLKQTGYVPIRLGFERRDGSAFEITILPRSVRFNELFTQFVVPYLSGVALLLGGLWVYRLGGDQRPARAFLLFTAAASVTTGAFLDMNTTHWFVLAWTLSTSIASAALAYLALVFPQQIRLIERFPAARFIPWLVALPLAIWGSREILAPGSPWGYVQAWFWGYVYFALAIALFLITLLVRMFASASALVRQQSRIIIFGAALAFGPILLLYLIPSALGQQPEFQAVVYFPLTFVFLISVAYAIVRYRLLDVDRVLSNAVTYLLTSAGAFLLFYLLITFLSLALRQSISPTNPLLMAVYLFLLAVLLNPLRNLMQSGIDRVFYRTRADYRRVLSALSRELATTPDLRRTLETLERELTLAVNPERLVLYFYDDDDRLYLPYSNQPHPELPLTPRNALVRLLERSPEALWLSPDRVFSADLATSVTARLAGSLPKQLGCIVFVPLRYEGRLIGFLALGPRNSGDPYTSDDLDFLSAVAGQSSLALENVRLFANLRRTLDETLEMKNLMDDIFASIASGVITTDVERKITLFNQAAERILKISASQVVGHPLPGALPALGPELEPFANDTIANNASTLDQEFTPTIPQRGPLYLRLSVTPLRDARLGTKGVTIVIDDLTEQRQLEADRERIRRTFGRVVAPRVRDKLLANPESLILDGIRQPLTVLFADLAGFTPFSERTPPEMLFEVLNSYLSLAAQAILAEEGTLDKFMGDAVLALWNAPDEQTDHTLRAVRAALAINRVAEAHRAHLDPAHHLHFSVGISTGEAMVGNVGTAELFNFTAVGDTVNLAQRLESIAGPGQILLSEPAYQAVSHLVIAEQLRPVKVKGRKQPVTPYAVTGLKDQPIQPAAPTPSPEGRRELLPLPKGEGQG
jgi:PAS domain S-box-containing protein